MRRSEDIHVQTLNASLLIAALVAIAAPSFAQPAQTGTISGEIKDATGGVLPGVTVTITSQDRGFSRSTVSDENGRYVFPAVPIGLYSVTATLQGFETAVSDRQPGRSRQDDQRPVRHEGRRADRHGRRSSATTPIVDRDNRDADHASEP